MKTVILNGGKFSTKDTMHEILKTKFEFPDYYENNLDSLFHCLTTEVERPISVHWINFEKSLEFLDDYTLDTLQVFNNVAELYPYKFIFRYDH